MFDKHLAGLDSTMGKMKFGIYEGMRNSQRKR